MRYTPIDLYPSHPDLEREEQKAKLDDTEWVERLAVEELNMDESGIVHLQDHTDINRLVDESALEFIDYLRELFELYTHTFNRLRGRTQAIGQIKIYKISNTVNDFMLFRNALKLIVRRESRGVIAIGFMSNHGSVFTAQVGKEAPSIDRAHQLKVHIGPFNKVTWRLGGEFVDSHAMARHYFSEFVRYSAR